jgi:hypothetical protein
MQVTHSFIYKNTTLVGGLYLLLITWTRNMDLGGIFI